MSGFRDQSLAETHLKTNNGKQDLLLPIFRSEHLGKHMAIDEKHIDGQFYTVLSNGSSGKVAMLVSSIEPAKIGECLAKFGSELAVVSVLSRDLSPTFEFVGNHFFPKAMQVGDKYHVIKHGLDSLQDIRIRLKNQALQEQRQQEAIFKKETKIKGEKKQKYRLCKF